MSNFPTEDPVQLPRRELVQFLENCYPRGILHSKRDRGAPKEESFAPDEPKRSLMGVPAPKGAKGAPRESPLQEEPVGLQEGSLRS